MTTNGSSESQSEDTFFDFGGSISRLEQKIDNMSNMFADFVKAVKEKGGAYPYPQAKAQGQMGAEELAKNPEFSKLMAEANEAKAKVENFEKAALIAEVAKGDSAVAGKLSQFSKADLQKMVDMSKAGVMDFSKTVKTQETKPTNSDFSKKREELTMKYNDFMSSGLTASAEEVQKELNAIPN